MSLDEFSDFPAVSGGGVAEAASAAAPLSTPPTIAVAPAKDDYQAHMQALIDAGATKDQILSYARQNGVDPSRVTGLDEALAYRDRGGKGVRYQVDNVASAATPVTTHADEFSDFPEASAPSSGVSRASSAAIGAGDTASLGLLDELAAGAWTLLPGADSYWSNPQSFADRYHINLETARAILGEAQAANPKSFVGGQLAGGLALPMGEGSSAAALAKQGAAYGAAYGAGSADGDVSDRLAGAAMGGIEGAALGGAIGAVGSRLASRLGARALPTLTPQQEMAQAAQRIGLDQHLLPADAGGPVVRGLTSATVQTPLGAPPIIKGAQRLTDEAGNLVQRQSATLGSAVPTEAAGQTAIEGAKKYIDLSRKAGARLYDIAANKAGSATVDPVNARKVLDDQIARLQAVPGGGAGLSEAQAFRDALNGSFSVQGIRDLRTELFVSPELRNTPAEARMKAVTDAAAQDVLNSLKAQGKDDAAAAFDAADSYWRDRLQTIDQVIKPIIGSAKAPKSGEDVIKALNAGMVGNNARVASFVSKLPPNEQSVVRASLLSPLGQGTDGFSLTRFSSDWSKIGTTAKRAIFGPDAVSALDDLAKVADQTKQAQRYSNFSNTARGVLTERTFGSVATGATIGLGLATMGKALALQGGAGLLLASPRFARWLARAPKTQLSTPAYLDRLTRIAASEPAIANDVLGFKANLESAIQGSRPAAANQEGQGGQPVNP